MEEQWFAFCPYCGAKYKKVRTNPHLCPGCNREYYINPHPCNAVILENSKKEILLVIRGIAPHKGKFDLPGGFINLGENAEDSVKREVREELGIRITDFSYFGSYVDRYPYKGISYYTLCFFYTARIPNRQPMKPADDVSSFIFVPKSRIPYGSLAFEGIKKALKKYSGATR